MILRIAKWIGIVLAGLVALVVILILGLNTSPGRRFVVDRLAGFETSSGISIHAARIDGSIYGRMVIRNLRVNDAQGTFLESPELVLDWRPFAYLHSKLDVRELSAGTVLFHRNPVLKPTPSDPNAPILPDIDLAIGKLRIDRFVLEKPVTGKPSVIRLAGAATIADGRARIDADADTLKEAGVVGGDRLRVKLDAAPDQNRFALEAHLAAPVGGLVDSYAKLGKPLTLDIDGQGDWANWKGRVVGLAGTEQLADLAITGVNGAFHTIGTVRPALVLAEGPATRLTRPGIRIDLTTKLANRASDTRLVASSDAFALTASGLIDLGKSRLGNLHVETQLLTPGVIAPNVAGRDVKLVADIDGPMATPTIDYRLSAAALSFGTTGVRGLAANGKAVIDTRRIAVPIHATVAAVTGLDAAAGGGLANIRLDGDIAYQDGKVATDNLHLASPRIDATAIVLADIAKGTYTGALKGRVNDYLVNGLGHIALTTDARLVPGRNNGFAVKGHVRAMTRRITNASVAAQLGGPALLDADVGYDLAGGATVSNLRIISKNIHVAGGHGSYSPDGRLAFHATGRTAAYGPFALDASGTVARPVAHLRAASPGLGVGIANLDATLTGTAAGYHVVAKGGSDYGPFAADVLLRPSRQTVIDIANVTFAGVQLKGTVAQTPAGPFAGMLAVGGSGLSGTVRLAAAGKDQQADLNLRAAAAKLPGPTLIVIGSGVVQATAILYPQGPAIFGRFALAQLTSGPLMIGRAQGRIDYRGGAGKVQLVASGSSGVPFDLAAQAALTPTRIVANLRGSANHIAFHLAQPAVIAKAGANWTLQPAMIVLPQGQVDLSGSFGAATSAHAVLRTLDLSIADAFAPSLGLGGKASGTLDYTGGKTVPNVRARLDITGFTRTAALTVSDPVDIAMLGTLGDGGGDMRALIRRNGQTFGRLAARLAPLGSGASLSQRIMGAPLSGGIRYNGPAEILWTLGGFANQQLTGNIAIGADFSGRVAQPSLTGVIRANQLRYENGTVGTVLTNIAIDGRFTQSSLQLVKLTAAAGRGTIAASGTVSLDATQGYPIDLQAVLQNAQLAKNDAMGATVSGNIRITNSKAAGGLIKGDLTLPEVRYQIVRQGAADVTDLTGVRRKGVQPASQTQDQALPSNWKLDIRLRADGRIYVSGMGLESEWRTDMRVGGTTAAPAVTGRLEVVRGTFSFASRRFDLDRGIVLFQGPLTNPALDISASTTATDVTATIAIGGYAQNPQLSFTSTPALPQDEVLSRLLFGTSVTSLSPMQAIQLAAALNSLRPGTGKGLNPLGKIRSVAGIDRLRVLGADDTTGRGTSIAAGKYISKNVYVEIVTDAKGFTATQLEISLSRALALLSQAGSFGGSNVSLRYKKDY